MPDETSADTETKTSEDAGVGYGKPPARTRFRKGQSGNPTGRRNGAKNLKTDLTEELQESVMVREGERSTKISKQRAIVKTLVNKTLKGDTAAARTLLGTMNKIFDLQDDTDGDAPLSVDDVEVLHAFEKRLLARANAPGRAASATAETPTDQLTAPVGPDTNQDRGEEVDEQC